MSSIGSTGPAVSLAGSLAGSQRSDGAHVKGGAATDAANHEQRAGALETSTDVAESEMTPERDADGRMADDDRGRDDGSPEPPRDPSASRRRRRPKGIDPTGLLGGRLDVDA